jgi:cysteine desulfurase
MSKGEIYLDNCMTTKPAPEALKAMQPYLTEQFWYPGSFVSTGETINAALTEFKSIIAQSLAAKPNDIHFTAGGTMANNIAIKGILTAHADKGTHIICSAVDYPDILTNAAFFEQNGFEVTYLQPDAEGLISAEALKAAIKEDTILFMTTIVNHVIGIIQPVTEYRQVLEQAGHKIYFHADAGQAYGKMPLDVNELGVDTMSVSSHKIHGPQGAGALYVKQGTRLGQLIHGVSRVDNLQTGGVNIALLAGFAKAAELTFADLKAQTDLLYSLSDYLLTSIEKAIPHVELNGPRGSKRVAHNVNVTIDYIEGEALTMMLDMHGITVATGSACASQGLTPNYVLLAIGKNHMQSHGSLKFTVSRYTTREDIDFTVAKLAEITTELRRRSPLYKEN